MVAEFCDVVNLDEVKTSEKSRLEFWQSLSQFWMKLNIDATFGEGTAALAFVLWNHRY